MSSFDITVGQRGGAEASEAPVFVSLPRGYRLTRQRPRCRRRPTRPLNVAPGPASIRLFLRGLIAASAMFFSNHGNAFTCFSSADQVRQESPGAWPSWTLRAPGHEGTKCWYSTTRAAAHDHQMSLTASTDHAGSMEHLERDSEVTGLAPHADTAGAPSPVPISSFEDRFSAMPSGTSADSGSNLQRVIDLFRGVGGH
jgi:hypothetical protein